MAWLRDKLRAWRAPAPARIKLTPVVIPDGAAIVIQYPGFLTEPQMLAVKAHLEAWAAPRGIRPVVLQGGICVQLLAEQDDGSNDRA